MNDVKFRITGDSSGAIRSLNEVRRGVREAGADIQQHLQGKLKELIAPAIIEETIRRTGEWATSITKAAQELGVSAEEMQGLGLAAKRTGQDTAKIMTYYEKLESAALKAVGGNAKLAQSFKNLGVTQDQLKHGTPGELFSAISRGTADHPEKGKDLLEIFGSKNILGVQALAKEFKGQSLDEYAKDNSSQIVGNQDVKDLAVAWEHTMEDLKSIAIKMIPVAKMLLAIVDGVLSQLSGLLSGIKHLFKFDDESTLFKASWARGIANVIPQMASGVFNLKNLVTGGKDKDWKWVKSGKEVYGGALSDEKYREAQGAADAVGTLATLGIGPITKGLGLAGKGIGTVAGIEKAGTIGAKMAAIGEGSLLTEGLAGKGFQAVLGRLEQSQVKKLYESLGKELGVTAESGATDIEALQSLTNEKFATLSTSKRLDFLKKNTGLFAGLGMAGIFGQKDVQGSDLFSSVLGGGKSTTDRRGNINLTSGFGEGAGSNPNLKIGGVFGVDVSLKILTLNQKMVDLLQQIVINTGAGIPSTVDTEPRIF